VLLAATLFLLKLDLSRSFIALFCLLVAALLTLERFLVLKSLRFWRRRGRNFRNVLICGVGEQAVRLAREIALRPELGISIRGFGDLRDPATLNPLLLDRFRDDVAAHAKVTVREVVSGGGAVVRSLSENAIDEVLFTDVVEVMPQVEEMVLICSEQGVRTTIVADLFSMGMVKSGISYFGGMPLIHFQTPPGDRWELAVKRIIDVLVSFVLLAVLSPLMAILALGVKLGPPGPVLFKQKRVGLNGRLFSLYKFRSMYNDAEEQKKALEGANEMVGPVFKVRKDPRVTPFGRILRRFSLDELPQLWNVFRGDMSLVGPRPPIPGEVSLYERKDRRRLSMRPGLTCTWQVSGRNNINDFGSWVKLDLEYIDNWSLGRDLLLLFRTIPAVLFGNGAR
jgi:exopolysaccharide biosynthesis polyprenyl glycosylphosphotransferase